MNLTKGATLSIFTFIITPIAIYLNWSKFLKGNSTTIFNFIVSIVFLLLWSSFSLYMGIKREKTYKRFILAYWGINIISFILILMISLSNSYDGIFLAPFAIWYGCPVYGMEYLLKSDSTTLNLIIAPLGLIFNVLGYWIGLRISNVDKS